MSNEPEPLPRLRELESEVEAEGREWMRRRLEEKLQAQAGRHGGVFPPRPAPSAAPAAGDDAPAQRLRGGAAERVARKKSR